MTLANDGVRYKTHLVHSVRSYDGLTDTVVQPEVVSRADLSKEAIDTVRKGMVEVVKSGTASRFFNKGNLPYTLAAKTGTAQIVEGKTDNGIFIAYGPVEKPEVAVAVVMEQGTSAASSEVAPPGAGRLFCRQDGRPGAHPARPAPALSAPACNFAQEALPEFFRSGGAKMVYLTVKLCYTGYKSG